MRLPSGPTTVEGGAGPSSSSPSCEFFEVGGTGGLVYAVLPHFCTCHYFQDTILEKGEGNFLIIIF